MANGEFELRKIVWADAFPFLRLFRTFKLSIHFGRLLLGLLCVLCCYFGGRVLDAIWIGADAGVLVGRGQVVEIEVYATHSAEDFEDWKVQARKSRRELIAKTLVLLGNVDNAADARTQLATQPANELLGSELHEQGIESVLQLISEHEEQGLAALDVKEETQAQPTKDWELERRTLRRAADYLRLLLNGKDTDRLAFSGGPGAALEKLRETSVNWTSDNHKLAMRVTRVQADLNRIAQSHHRGPFIELLKYEQRCFAGAIRGACAFRWGFGGGGLERQPSLCGGGASAGNGVIWLVTQHPGYALLYAIWHFIVFAFFGGAICRHAAIQSARDETISISETLRFAREKYTGLLLAPLFPALFFLLIAIVIFLGGLVGIIPFVGPILVGLLYGLALLGGFALAMILIATVLGLHLMWPTIAVEGSDSFDAISHAFSYVGQRIWNVGFYSLILLVYGALSFVMVRLIGLVMLKLTHSFCNAGMSFCGLLGSAETSTFTKLDAMWQMPNWSDLPLLPTIGDAPYWGTFFNAPLCFSEGLAAFLIACWVFMVVGLVGAFVVNFFFCGSTQMYFLLRRDVDAVDYEEIFYEEPEEDLPPIEPMQPAEPVEAPEPKPDLPTEPVEAPEPKPDLPTDENSEQP